MLRLRQRAGLLPTLDRWSQLQGYGRLITKASGVATAAYVGWEIGTGINKLFGRVELPAATVGPVTDERWDLRDGTDAAGALPDEVGFNWAWRKGSNGSLFHNYVTPAPPGIYYGIDDAPAFAYNLGYMDWGAYWHSSFVTLAELRLMDDVSTTPFPNWGADGDPVLQSPMPPMPDAAAIDAAIEAMYDSAAGAFFRAVTEWTFDPNGGGAVAPDDPRSVGAPSPPELDPNEPGGPMPETIELKPPGAGQSATSYKRDLEEDGFRVRIAYDPEIDPDLPEDTPTGSRPKPHSWPRPGDDVTVDASNPPATDERVEDCAPQGGTAPNPDVYGAPVTGMEPYDLFPSNPFYDVSSGVTVGSDVPSGKTVLRVGRAQFENGDWKGFGWRKITAKHGWGPTQDAEAREALRNPPVPARGGTNRVNHYGGTYPSPRRSGLNCRFVVRVERAALSEDAGENSGRAPGIETAYGADLP